MPELPEVETVRRGLEPHLVGGRITRARTTRPDYVRHDATPRALLQGAEIASVTRLGKQLAIHASDGRVVCLHLGMSGQVLVQPRAQRVKLPTHAHVVWTVGGDAADGVRVVLRDPRRFGGVWTLTDEAALERHWAPLGPDALTCRAKVLTEALSGSRASIKARLLDQGVVAGIGNIYADEALFRARVHPLRPAGALGGAEYTALAGAIRSVLRAAIRRGGSTLRDFVHPDGSAGGFRARHAVYGRAGESCRRCGNPLVSGTIAQRTTVWCSTCQGVT